MPRHTLRLLLVPLVLLSASACSNSPSPTAPTTVTQWLQGTWTGTVSTPGGDGAVRITLQSRIDGAAEWASGTYELRTAGSTATGTVDGINVLGGASILLTPQGPPRCPSDASSASAGSLLFGARPDGNRLSGAGTWTQCAVSTQVAVVLTKQ